MLIHSLKKHSSRPLEIYVFNGTHDTIERDNESPVRVNMPLEIKYRNYTEFSNYRWFIPKLCNFEGRAIWMDSDMVCLEDIAQFFDTEMGDNALLAKPAAYGETDQKKWGLSMILIDCAKCQFAPEHYFQEISDGKYTYTDLHQMTPAFLEYHPFKIGTISPGWNDFDQLTEKTKLIHYTDLFRQPWKAQGHPFGKLWFQYFHEAIEAGELTKEDVEKTRTRFYVRPNIWEGNTPQKPSLIKRVIKKVLNRLRLIRLK